MRKTVAILGIPIDDLNMEQVLERCEQFVRSGRFHQVATANTDFLVKALEDPELKAILLAADLVVPDGMPLVIASKWLRAGLRERVTGADLVPRLARAAASRGLTMFMLGGAPDVAAVAKVRLEERNPGLRIVGCMSPPKASIVEMDNEGILAEIEAANPDILLVAFGNPKQEKWIYMHRHRLKVPVCIGVGGTFDFIAGSVARAPEWVQRSGCEWLFRLVQEPRRLWRRYAHDLFQFSRLISRQLWAMRRSGEPGAPRVTDVQVGEWTIISVCGPVDARLLPELQFATERALAVPTHLVLDLLAATNVDSAVLGTLLNLPKRAGYVGRELRLVGVHGRVRQAVRAARAEQTFTIYETVADAIIGGQSGSLSVDVAAEIPRAIVSFRGRATMDNTQQVESALSGIPSDVERISLDMREVTYIDCGMLVTLRRFVAQRSGTKCRVSLAPSEAVQRAIQAENLNGVFHIVSAPEPGERIPAGR